MTNSNPAPEQIAAARKKAGLSRAEAAALIYKSPRSWESWEQGRRSMDLASWELFCLKAAMLEVRPGRDLFVVRNERGRVEWALDREEEAIRRVAQAAGLPGSEWTYERYVPSDQVA